MKKLNKKKNGPSVRGLLVRQIEDLVGLLIMITFTIMVGVVMIETASRGYRECLTGDVPTGVGYLSMSVLSTLVALFLGQWVVDKALAWMMAWGELPQVLHQDQVEALKDQAFGGLILLGVTLIGLAAAAATGWAIGLVTVVKPFGFSLLWGVVAIISGIITLFCGVTILFLLEDWVGNWAELARGGIPSCTFGRK